MAYLGNLAYVQGELEGAAALYREGLVLLRTARDPLVTAVSLDVDYVVRRTQIPR